MQVNDEQRERERERDDSGRKLQLVSRLWITAQKTQNKDCSYPRTVNNWFDVVAHSLFMGHGSVNKIIILEVFRLGTLILMCINILYRYIKGKQQIQSRFFFFYLSRATVLAFFFKKKNVLAVCVIGSLIREGRFH